MEGGRRAEVFRYFLRLGAVGFGGPNAHIAMMHEQIVRRRRWLTEERFVQMLGTSNLIPGPSSTALAIHIGYERGRRLGGVLAGVGFLLPAFALVLGLSWAYVAFGPSELRDDLLAGIQPVVPAIVLVTLWRLRAAFTRDALSVVLWLAAAALTLAFPRLSPVLILAGGLIALVVESRASSGGTARSIAGPLPVLAAGLVLLSGLSELPALGWVFLRTGLLLFGGGLVLLPLLEPEVLAHGWLSRAELLDGIAIGQSTPGPVVITAAFVGYIVAGVTGAAVATVAIVLPTFVLVLTATGPLLARFREHPKAAAFVRGVTAAALGTLVGSTGLLLPTAIGSPFRSVLFLVAIPSLSLGTPVVLMVLGGAALGAIGGALGWV